MSDPSMMPLVEETYARIEYAKRAFKGLGRECDYRFTPWPLIERLVERIEELEAEARPKPVECKHDDVEHLGTVEYAGHSEGLKCRQCGRKAFVDWDRLRHLAELTPGERKVQLASAFRKAIARVEEIA